MKIKYKMDISVLIFKIKDSIGARILIKRTVIKEVKHLSYSGFQLTETQETESKLLSYSFSVAQ
jgi:hypothetical protein